MVDPSGNPLRPIIDPAPPVDLAGLRPPTRLEAFARRRFASFLASTVVLAAVVALGARSVLLFHEHWRIAVSALIGLAALALLIGNLGDLRHGWWRV